MAWNWLQISKLMSCLKLNENRNLNEKYFLKIKKNYCYTVHCDKLIPRVWSNFIHLICVTQTEKKNASVQSETRTCLYHLFNYIGLFSWHSYHSINQSSLFNFYFYSVSFEMHCIVREVDMNYMMVISRRQYI